jgi:hypothetical protein
VKREEEQWGGGGYRIALGNTLGCKVGLRRMLW